MSVELILILGLILILVVPIYFEINVGVVAFIVAFLMGILLLDMSPKDILVGFPEGIFVVLVGITLLMSVAQLNGTVDWLVNRLVRLAGGRLVLLPWVLFAVAVITSTLGPAAAPILFIVGIGFVVRFGLSPLLVVAMIIHGNQSGGYSPIAPYGVLIGQLAETSAMAYSPMALYFGVVSFHFALAAVVFLLLGGRKLIGRHVDEAELMQGEATGSGGVQLSIEQLLTLIGFLVLILGVLFYQVHIGFLALIISAVLMIAGDKDNRQKAVSQIAWPVVLIITGILTYVHLLEAAGATDWLVTQASYLGSPLLIALILCFIIGVVTGIASTMGTIGILVPLSAPLAAGGALDGTGLLTAMSISAAVTDISPFSTLGALFIAMASESLNREKILRSQLKYTLCMMGLIPLVAWMIFVVIPSLS